MTDQRIAKLADILVNYSTKVKQGDKCLIRASIPSIPLMTEVYRAVHRAGGVAELMMYDDDLLRIKLEESNFEQLSMVSDFTQKAFSEYDVFYSLRGAANSRALTSVDPKKMKAFQEARRVLMKTYMERSAKGDLRWVVTNTPTHGYAQDADMSLEEFEDFVYKACFVDKEDPVAEWKKISDMQQILVDFLVGKKHIHAIGPNIDMTLSIDGRTFINSDGQHNMPSGEIFTGPVENSVNGWVNFTYPAVYLSREVVGAKLRFEEGRIVEATADKGEDVLVNTLNTDEGARYLGEWAIGTNNGIQQFTKQILFDEKIGGTIHMAVGAGYPETGSKNTSAIHWDMICDMKDGGKIFVDDELFYDSGKFLIL